MLHSRHRTGQVAAFDSLGTQQKLIGKTVRVTGKIEVSIGGLQCVSNSAMTDDLVTGPTGKEQ